MIQDINWPPKIFVTGIDTDAGKSFATGWIAKKMINQGLNVITQKLVQTGNHEYSEDIDTHRTIMGCGQLDVDINHLTAPEIYSYPASPHLAAKIDNRPINIDKIDNATKKLENLYDYILIEGAGGIMVPLKEDYLTLNYVSDRELPVIVVTGGKLGSLNHLLLNLKVLMAENIEIFAVAYNLYFDEDKIICEDSRIFIKEWLKRNLPNTHYIEIPNIKL